MRNKLTIECKVDLGEQHDLKRILTRRQWRMMRLWTICRYNNRCYFCDAVDSTLCMYALWDWDEKNYVRRLVDVVPLCVNCYKLKNIVNYRRRGGKYCGWMNDQLIRHYCMQNNCDVEGFVNAVREACILSQKRHEREWSVDYGRYSDWVKVARDGYKQQLMF